MQSSTEILCQDLIELVTDYFEGALPDEERIRFEAHIAECYKCSAYIEQMRRTVQTLGRLTEDSIPTPAMSELLKAFRGWKAN